MNFLKNFLHKHEEPKYQAKILTIADLHGRLRPKDINMEMFQEIDAIIMLGDIDYRDYFILKNYIPKEIPVYGIRGNHDAQIKLEDYGIQDIHGKLIEVNDIRIVGWEGSFKYKPSAVGFTQDESKDFAKILIKAYGENVDYLFSHDAPYNVDTVDAAHKGLKGISEYITKTGCKNIHGHFHQSYKTQKQQCVFGFEQITLTK